MLGTLRGRAGGGAWGALAPPLLFRMVIFFFYFGYSDLSLTTQTRFSNLTILNTHKERTTLAPSENLTPNCLGDTQPLSIYLNFGLTWGPGCNLLF